MVPQLEIRGVTKAYPASSAAAKNLQQHVVLGGVDLAVRREEFVAIVGDSGCGKSTLLMLLAGLLRPDTGSITMDGVPIEGPDRDRGVVFQHYSLLPWLTVEENIRLAVDQTFGAESAEERERRVLRWIDLVHLRPARNKLPRQLSGGMKQRVAVARAFATEPKVLLLDEPFSALDALTRVTLQSELENIFEAGRKTVIMITNDVDEAIALADRVVPMTRQGRLLDAIEVELPRPRTAIDRIVDPRFKQLRAELSKRLRSEDSAGGSRIRNRIEATRGSVEVRSGPASHPLLELRDVCKDYDTATGLHPIVRDVTFDVNEGEFVSIIGHSGCGKTTVLSMIAGLTTATSGQLLLAGKNIEGPGAERSMVFQAHSLLPWLTAEENVRLGVDAKYRHASRHERAEIALDFLRRVGLEDSKGKRPSEMSAGMRQRVGVARAFAVAPRLLLLDEPFGSLDSMTRMELQDVLVDLRAKSRCAAILVTHDVDEALLLSDRIVLMTDGPAARIGRILEVPLPTPRDRTAIVDSLEYKELREVMLEFLAETSARRPQSALATSPA